MKPSLIREGRSYTNKSGRSERHVFAVGHHVKVRWLGDDKNEPIGEAGVQYVETRLGNTFYGRQSGKRPNTMYLSAFASWAAAEVAEGDEASHEPLLQANEMSGS